MGRREGSIKTRKTACKEALVQGVKLGDRLRRAYTSSDLLGTSPLTQQVWVS